MFHCLLLEYLLCGILIKRCASDGVISNIGGQSGHTFLNHLCYADDLCLISLSSAGMQKLLNLCSKYVVDHSLTYNAEKSFSLCFIPRTVKISRPPWHMLFSLLLIY